jgi:hypothetical protein
MHLGDSKVSLVGDSPGVSLMPNFGGVGVGGECTGSFEREAGAEGADVGEDGEGTDPTGPTLLEGGAVPVRDGPAQVEAAAVDALVGTRVVRVVEAEPRSEDASGGDDSAPCHREALASTYPGMSPLRPLDIVDPGAIEQGLPGFPDVPPSLSNWRQVEEGVDLACLQVVAVSQLLWESLATVG